MYYYYRNVFNCFSPENYLISNNDRMMTINDVMKCREPNSYYLQFIPGFGTYPHLEVKLKETVEKPGFDIECWIWNHVPRLSNSSNIQVNWRARKTPGMPAHNMYIHHLASLFVTYTIVAQIQATDQDLQLAVASLVKEYSDALKNNRALSQEPSTNVALYVKRVAAIRQLPPLVRWFAATYQISQGGVVLHKCH